jgi:phosphoserine phosphatase
MPQLLFLKQQTFSENQFASELASLLPNLSSNYKVSNPIFTCAFGHSCLAYTTEMAVSKPELLEIRKKVAGIRMDVLFIDAYIDPHHPNIFCFDMDSTVIQEEVIDELARKHNVFEEVSAVTKQAMEGGMAFDEALKLRVKHLKGLSRKSFEEVYDLLNLNPGMDIVLKELPSRLSFIAILSGGFTPVLELFAKKYPIDFFRANQLEEDQNIFTGEILGEIINKERKAQYLNQMISEKNIPRAQVVAVGDGANDGLMLQTATIGIGFHAKQGLKDQITNWFDYCDMRALLFLFRPTI